MFERRTDLLRLLAVAETGTIGAAAERSNVTQPTLTRDIARLEQRFGGLLFDYGESTTRRSWEPNSLK